MTNDPSRARDPGHHLLAAFVDEILVICPGCERRVAVRPAGEDASLFAPRRIACGQCGTVKSWPPEGKKAGPKTVRLDQHGGADPYLGLPLWLQTPCRGHVLWAWNERHLTELERWIGADLRERTRTPGPAATDRHETMLESLPDWMTTAGARDDVIRSLSRLRGLVVG